MRDYGKVSPQFWIGETGKLLRGNTEAQVLALYLMTSPHATMTGIFHCPIIYMAHETGLSLDGASKGLARLIEVGFCEYDESSESVFVINMAAHQIDDYLKPNDKRVFGLRKYVENMTPARFQSRFIEIYGKRFHLVNKAEKASPYEAPSMPPRSQEQEQEQEQEINTPITPKGAIGIDSFLDSCRRSGQKPIPEDDPVFEYGDKIGIPVDFLRLAWRELVDRSRESGKRYKDWRKAFRNCVRANWYKLWFISPDGVVSLTTQGMAAQKMHRDAA